MIIASKKKGKICFVFLCINSYNLIIFDFSKSYMSIYKNTISKLFTKISLVVFIWGFFGLFATVYGQIDIEKKIDQPIRTFPQKPQKTERIKNDSINILSSKKDSLKVSTDSLNRSALTSKLEHYAEDYTEIDHQNQSIVLYNKARIKYQDFELTAGIIYIDQNKKEIYAGRIRDSLGKLTQRPVFIQGNTKTENDSIRFNYETKKALVWNTFTKEGEISLISEVTKKYNDSVMFVSNVKFTTSEDPQNPEYYFLAKKGKIVPGKKIVVGTTQMWIEDVPTPFVLPFGFFPLISKRSSGFILPSFADTRKGYSLQNGGFYWAINPYIDLSTTADFYTNGSYGLRIGSRYIKRYRFNGNFTFNYENNIQSSIGLPNYSKSTNWNIRWTHSIDPKSSPLSSFTANVNFGSSKYYRNSDNYFVVTNIDNQLRNELSSSVNYSKRFAHLPLDFNLSLNHNQNVNEEKIYLTLPQFNLNVHRIYPFSKNGRKKNFLQKLNFTYRMDAVNKITTTDSLLFTSGMWDGRQIGAKHTLPVSTDVKILKYINFKPQIRYTEVWEGQYIDKYWDPQANQGNGELITENKQGFKNFRNIDLSAGFSTNIYGTYIFGENKKIMGVRHTISPSLSYRYNPKFSQYIYQYEDGNGDFVDYTQFDQGLYGRPNLTEQKTLVLSLNQNFEAKIKTKEGKSKKIRFLNISNSYDFLRDSMRLSPFNLTSSFDLAKGLRINLRSQFDPYAIENAQVLKDLAISKGQGIGRFSNFSFNTSYRFSNDMFKKKGKEEANENSQERNKETAEIDAPYYNSIKWNFNVGYDFRYRNKAYSLTDTPSIVGNTVSLRGNINFTENWSVGITSGYDFVNKGVIPTSLNFTRDLKSWVMRFNWRPIGNYKSWYFFIGIKSSVLSDIKFDKHNEPVKKFF
jgi:lipopolysaccharide assembly outer membrane protein LptD (OstA)